MSRPGPGELPPIPTTKPVAPPPLSDGNTSAQLKADIDSGRTGDKNPVFDLALAPLGTDDEAAGHPPSPHRIAMARQYENVQRWAFGGRKSGAAHKKRDGVPVVFVLFIAAIALIIPAGMIWLAR
jgi:hypothetical protein